jgi:hypothetical protein
MDCASCLNHSSWPAPKNIQRTLPTPGRQKALQIQVAIGGNITKFRGFSRELRGVNSGLVNYGNFCIDLLHFQADY